MKTTASNLAGPLKRRSFFVAAVGVIAGAWTGPGLVRRLVGSGTGSDENRSEITITINPMAVPRKAKGVNRHG